MERRTLLCSDSTNPAAAIYLLSTFSFNSVWPASALPSDRSHNILYLTSPSAPLTRESPISCHSPFGWLRQRVLEQAVEGWERLASTVLLKFINPRKHRCRPFLRVGGKFDLGLSFRAFALLFLDESDRWFRVHAFCSPECLSYE